MTLRRWQTVALCRVKTTPSKRKKGRNVSCRFFFQAEDGIRYLTVTGVQTCALPICMRRELVRVCAPSVARVPLVTHFAGHNYPTFPWWDLFNTVHGKSELTGAEIMIDRKSVV